MDIELSFGEWLKRERKALGLTQEELARGASCSVVTIRKIESDERRPSPQVAELLANCLGIPPANRTIFLQVARGERPVARLRRAEEMREHRDEMALPAHSREPEEAGARERRGQNLPISLLPFVGREYELDYIVRTLQTPECRLLTLLGPGGIGKTRLAVEAARASASFFANGTAFVSLAALPSAEFIVPAIAEALEFTFSGPATPRAQLLHFLRGQSLLLVLDNAEHLLNGIGWLTEILQQAPEIKLLVTSREQLAIPGEWLFDLQGLPYPADGPVEKPETYAAVALFVQSARRLSADFDPLAQRQAVIRICQLVEGMPLGLELAAAWVHVLGCEEIAREIERNLDFLATKQRGTPERHRSLRAVFDHSWKLLTTEERQALRRLSVFRGGFDREAANRVANVSLSGLLALVSKSLVRRVEAGRYSLHELIRQHAAGHLQDQAEEYQATLDAHAQHYLALVAEGLPALRSPEQQRALARLSLEIDNLRAAWRRAIETHQAEWLEPAMPGLFWFLERRGWIQDALTAFQDVATAWSPGSSREQRSAVGLALAYQSGIKLRGGWVTEALALVRPSLDLLRPLDHPAALSDALIIYGAANYFSGTFTTGRESLYEAQALKQALGDRWGAALCRIYLGLMAQALGEFGEMQRLAEEALAIFRSLGDPRATIDALRLLGLALIKTGPLPQALDRLRESVTLCRAVGERWRLGGALYALGLVQLAQKEYSEAKDAFEESARMFRETEFWFGYAQARLGQGQVALARGGTASARAAFLDGLQTAMMGNAVPLALEAILGIARLEAQIGNQASALALAWFIQLQPRLEQSTKVGVQHLLAALEPHLPAEQAQAERERASQRSLAELVAELGER